ncbi:MAG: alpha/beta hydrolase [Desulfuromonadales bacterium]|nr:MAG: alpha/beta hydrolase [Desulfuromonadales bacterium]
MTRLYTLILLMVCLWWAQSASAASQPYFYPFVNPYEATVMELPKAYEVKLPEYVPTREFTLDVFPKREIPDVFWYEDGLTCSLAYQDHKAPLIFVVAGTGSRYNTPRMVKLQKALHQGGFHVITITSPTHMDFVVNASEGLPGDSLDDAKDLYRVMEMAYEKVREKIEVSSFALTGYSLGAFNAAHIAKLDDEKKRFNFSKVLLINPPVSLYDSVTALDQLLVENIPGGLGKFDLWFKSVLAKLASVTKEMGHTELSGDFIYNAYKRLPPQEENLAALIGLAFRMSSANMIFTADVMNGGGYIVPKNARLNNSTSLTRYAMVSYRTRFVDYFNEYFLPYSQKRDPYLTRQGLMDRLSLKSIEPYLKSTGKIGLIHNEDDIILMPGEIEYLQGVFGNRARVFPTGGHMGNMFHPDIVRSMINFLSGKEI